MKKKLFTAMLTAAFILAVGIAPAPAEDVSAVLRAGGGAVGGAGFVMLTGVAKIVSDEHKKISITVVPGGWVGNIARVNSGELDLASTANTLCQKAENGEKPLDEPVPNVRSLFNVQDTMYYFMFARKDFPANSVQEIIDKKMPARICTLSPGSVTEMQFQSALASQGVSWDDIKAWGGEVNFVKWGDAVNLVKDGHADIICAAALGKAGWAMELATVRDMKVLEWSPELLESINKRTGTRTEVMPAGLYEGIDYERKCPASSGEIIINAGVPNDVAYAIVKAMAENEKAYQAHHAAFKSFTAAGMARGMYLPIHPGAEKYYKEKGWLK
jgi:TRAP transporter TAXI family solute receptor